MDNSNSKKPKILVGFSEIAGYYVNLFVGLAQLGCEVGYINNRYFKFQYNEYKNYNHPFLNFYIDTCRKFRVENHFLSKISCAVLTPIVIFWMVIKYDVFILGSDSTLLKYWEYKVLKFFKKKVIYVSLGSDSRPSVMSGVYKDDSKEGQFSVFETVDNFLQTKKKVQFFEEHSNIFINYPQHAHFNRRPFINGMNIGFPILMNKVKSSLKSQSGNSVRILHAPSRPNAKGTNFFRQIIKELKSEGIEIDWVEIVNRPNSEVLEELVNCDIVLDELFSDLPLGGLGSEAASFGKPVLVGGYYAESIKTDISKEVIPPSYYVLPDQVKETLRMLCLSPELRGKAGIELQEFVTKNWNNKAIAQKFLDLISGDFDKRWLFSPEKISYFNGWGLSKEEAIQNMEEILDHLKGLDYDTVSNFLSQLKKEKVAETIS